MKHPVQLRAEAGPPHWLRQSSSGQSELRTPRAAGLGANVAPQGPLHSESYGPEARPSASASGPQDRAVSLGLKATLGGLQSSKISPDWQGADTDSGSNMQWREAVLY